MISSKSPGFRELYLARQNEFRFFCLINTKNIVFLNFGCWLLPEKFSFCPKNNGFARVWGVAHTPMIILCHEIRKMPVIIS